jgi:hypothetical protein
MFDQRPLDDPGSQAAPPEAVARCLVCVPKGSESLQSARLGPSGSVSIGSDQVDDVGAPMFLASGPGVSGRHARVSADESGAYVVDLCSTHGTVLNGRRLVPRVPTRLRSGDALGIGGSWLTWFDPREAAEQRLPQPAELRLRLENRVDVALNYRELDLWADVMGQWLGVNTFQAACARELRRAEYYGSPLCVVVFRLPSRPDGERPVRLPDRVEEHVSQAWELFGERQAFLGRLGADEWGVALPGAELDAGRSHAGTLKIALEMSARSSWRLERMRSGVGSVRSLRAPSDLAALMDDARGAAQVGDLLDLARADMQA